MARRNRTAIFDVVDELPLLGGRLKDVRQQLGITQVQLAELMGIGQTALSHFEDRTDVRISTLRDYVASLGGTLEVTANFNGLGKIELLSTASQPLPLAELDDQLVLPGFPNPVPKNAGRDIIFSIKPHYASQILGGSKTVELRRRFSSEVNPGVMAWIYSTTPTRALTGAATIADVQCMPVVEIWEAFSNYACIERSDFDSYLSGVESGYAISLSSPRTLRRPLPLPELRERFGFEPPQSYQYASERLSGLVNEEWSQSPN
jgi:predicted transcriptional regulator